MTTVATTHDQAASRPVAVGNEADCVLVSHTACWTLAVEALSKLTKVRDQRIEELISAQRTRRQAWNRWLPRWCHYSLRKAEIQCAHTSKVLAIFQDTAAEADASRRLLALCVANHNITVSAPKQDWHVLQQYLSQP